MALFDFDQALQRLAGGVRRPPLALDATGKPTTVPYSGMFPPTRASLQAQMAGAGPRPMDPMAGLDLGPMFPNFGMEPQTGQIGPVETWTDDEYAQAVGDVAQKIKAQEEARARQAQIDLHGMRPGQRWPMDAGSGAYNDGGRNGWIDPTEMGDIAAGTADNPYAPRGMGRSSGVGQTGTPTRGYGRGFLEQANNPDPRNLGPFIPEAPRVNPAAQEYPGGLQALAEAELNNLPDGVLHLSPGSRMNRERGYNEVVIPAARAKLAGQDYEVPTIDGSGLYTPERLQEIKDQKAAGRQRAADRDANNLASRERFSGNLGASASDMMQADFMRKLLSGDAGELGDAITRRIVLGPGADAADDRASREKIAADQIAAQERERKNALESGTQGRVLESMKGMGMTPPLPPTNGSEKDLAAYQQQLRVYNDTYEALFAQQWALDHGGQLPPEGIGSSPFRVPYDDGQQGEGVPVPPQGTVDMSASAPNSNWLGRMGPLSVLFHSLGLTN